MGSGVEDEDGGEAERGETDGVVEMEVNLG